MTDPQSLITVSLAALTGTAMLLAAAVAGWRGWLQLKRCELERAAPAVPAAAGARIELADLRERIRKLEAIAAGIDV